MREREHLVVLDFLSFFFLIFKFNLINLFIVQQVLISYLFYTYCVYMQSQSPNLYLTFKFNQQMSLDLQEIFNKVIFFIFLFFIFFFKEN